MTRDNPTLLPDDWLVDFTDHLLQGETNIQPSDGPDPETRALAETLLSLKRAFPDANLSALKKKQMWTQMLHQWHKEQQEKPHWLNIFHPAHRPALAYALAVLIPLTILASALLSREGGSLSASAGLHIPGAFPWIALTGLLLLLVWLTQRKS